MTTGKTIALTSWTLVGKVMSLFLNMLSRLVIEISWLQSPSAVILEPKKIKSDTVSTVSPSISHEVMGRDAMIFDQRYTEVSPHTNQNDQILQTINAGEDVKKREPSYIVGGNANYYSHYGEQIL